jgi:hypothetical protein
MHIWGNNNRKMQRGKIEKGEDKRKYNNNLGE